MAARTRAWLSRCQTLLSMMNRVVTAGRSSLSVALATCDPSRIQLEIQGGESVECGHLPSPRHHFAEGLIDGVLRRRHSQHVFCLAE